MLKKIVITLCILAAVMMAVVAVPVFFEDDIRAEIDKQIGSGIRADIQYKDFGISILSDFPNLSASLEDFNILNREPFRGDTLMAAQNLSISVDLKSVLFGDTPKINGIIAEGMRLNIRVLANGATNYDIAVPSENPADTSGFSAKIDHWEITDGRITYRDDLYKVNFIAEGFQHSGSGDIEDAEFDLLTKTLIESFDMDYEGVNYFSKKRAEADMTLGINTEEFKFTFKENSLKINNLLTKFDGWFLMADDYFDMDISFGAPESSFKDLLSLVPGAYTADFKGLEAEGNLTFNGFVRGKYTDQRMPAFNMNIKTADSRFKYPALPTAVSGIFVDMEIDNKDGILENTVTDIRDFRMNIGQNPVSGKVRIKGLSTYEVKADVNARINLAQMIEVFPVAGTELRGLFEMKVHAEGKYDEAKKTIPKVQALMSLTNGYAKSADYPFAAENMQLGMRMSNTTGRMEDTEAEVSKFTLTTDGQPFEASGNFKNFDDVIYNLQVKGKIDLDKMTKIYPLEDMKVAGLLDMNLKTSGRQSDALAQRYEKLPTSGSAVLKNFVFEGKDVANPVRITEAQMTVTPRELNLQNFTGFFGSSDVKMRGKIENYLDYVFRENALLQGQLFLESDNFNANEWMSEEETTDSTVMAPVEIPKNIDFVFQSKFKRMLFQNLDLRDAQGTIKVSGGVMQLNGFNFNTLGGQFAATGAYDSRDMGRPAFDFDFSVQNLSVGQAAANFNTFAALAPVAKNLEGNFNTNFNLKGLLGQDMMPMMQSLTGGGGVKLLSADLKNMKIFDQISTLTGLENLNKYSLKDVILSADVQDGNLIVKPFDVKLGDYGANISGITSYDGKIQYLVKMDIPKAKMNSKITSALNMLGEKASAGETVQMNFNVGGTFLAPKVSPTGGGTQDLVKDAVKERIETEKQAVKDSSVKLIKDIFTDTTGTKKPAEKVNDAINKWKDRFNFGKKKEETKPDTTKAGGN